MEMKFMVSEAPGTLSEDLGGEDSHQIRLAKGLGSYFPPLEQ